MSTNPKEMYVGKATSEAVTGDARDDTGRLKSSGMNRDRTDKHAVPDEFDFAAARSSLGKNKKQASEAPPSVAADETASNAAPADAPTSESPAMERKSSAASGMRSVAASQGKPPGTPSRVGTPVGAPEASPVAMSRQGSVHSQQASAVQQLSRQGSRASLPPTAPAGAGSRQGSAAGSDHAPSNPALSRQGSAAILSQPPLSRQGSTASRQYSATQAAAPQSFVPIEAPPQDDLSGVDWQLTTNTLRADIEKLEKKLAKKEEELAKEKDSSCQCQQKVADLEARLQQTTTTKGKGGRDSAMMNQLKDQAEKDRVTIAKLEADIAHKSATIRDLQAAQDGTGSRRGSRQGSRQGSRRGSVSPSFKPQQMQSINSVGNSQLEAMQHEMAQLRAGNQQRETLIKQLTLQLEAAHEAIVAAAHKGFEYDVKLHQARSTLVTMLKKERQSPRRGSHSPARGSSASPGACSVPPTAAPVFTASPNAPLHHSPAQSRAYGYHTHNIKTPGSPHSLC